MTDTEKKLDALTAKYYLDRMIELFANHSAEHPNHPFGVSVFCVKCGDEHGTERD